MLNIDLMYLFYFFVYFCSGFLAEANRVVRCITCDGAVHDDCIKVAVCIVSISDFEFLISYLCRNGSSDLERVLVVEEAGL